MSTERPGKLWCLRQAISCMNRQYGRLFNEVYLCIGQPWALPHHKCGVPGAAHSSRSCVRVDSALQRLLHLLAAAVPLDA